MIAYELVSEYESGIRGRGFDLFEPDENYE